MLRRPALLLPPLLLASLLGASTAGAQDWLALLPPCAYEEEASRPGTLELLYPRAGMPAVVRSGGVLVTRVKLRSALMPPPGRQQPRALRGWGAELIGRSILGPTQPSGQAAFPTPEHRYPVRVSNVRPDGPSSLVFRAHIPIPVWVAPGTYDLRLRVPGGGREESAGTVRVVEGEEPIQVGWLGAPPAGPEGRAARREILRALAWHPRVEVWAAHPAWLSALPEVPESEPLPALLAIPEGGTPAVFFTGERYLTLGRCESRYLPFDRALEGIRAQRPGELSRFSASRLPEPGQVRTGRYEGPAPRLPAPTVQREREQLVLTLPRPAGSGRRGPRSLRVDLLLPRSPFGYFLRGAREIRYWPSVFVPPEGQPPGVLAQVRAEPGATLRARFRREDGLPALRFSPSSHPRSGYPTTIRLHPRLPEGSRIFWRYGVDENHLGPELHHTFSRAGEHDLTLWAIGPSGASRQTAGRVSIEADLRDGGCSISPSQGPGSGSGSGPVAVWLLALLLGWTMLLRRRE